MDYLLLRIIFLTESDAVKIKNDVDILKYATVDFIEKNETTNILCFYLTNPIDKDKIIEYLLNSKYNITIQ
jgi:hypothetical protein